MLKKFVGFIWRKIPNSLRKRIVRTNQNKFTVSAGVVINNREGKFLLLDHVFRAGSGWGIPGGFLEYGEQPVEALKRELCEETGLELRNIEMISVQTIGKHIEILFRAEAEGEVLVNNFEITSAKWFDLEELPAEMDDVQKENVKKLFNSRARI